MPPSCLSNIWIIWACLQPKQVHSLDTKPEPRAKWPGQKDKLRLPGLEVFLQALKRLQVWNLWHVAPDLPLGASWKASAVGSKLCIQTARGATVCGSLASIAGSSSAAMPSPCTITVHSSPSPKVLEHGERQALKCARLFGCAGTCLT